MAILADVQEMGLKLCVPLPMRVPFRIRSSTDYSYTNLSKWQVLLQRLPLSVLVIDLDQNFPDGKFCGALAALEPSQAWVSTYRPHKPPGSASGWRRTKWISAGATMSTPFYYAILAPRSICLFASFTLCLKYIAPADSFLRCHHVIMTQKPYDFYDSEATGTATKPIWRRPRETAKGRFHLDLSLNPASINGILLNLHFFCPTLPLFRCLLSRRCWSCGVAGTRWIKSRSSYICIYMHTMHWPTTPGDAYHHQL